MELKNVLTQAELRVLHQISEGESTKSIAKQLGITPKTVENHRYHIAKKLDLSGNNCVLKFALSHKPITKFS